MKRAPIPTMWELSEAQAHPSHLTSDERYSEPHTETLLTPAPKHGFIRRTCENAWLIPGILFAASLTAAITWASWPAWVLAALMALAFIFCVTVSWCDDRETDREVFGWGAIVTGVLALVIGVAFGLALWIGAVAR